MAASSVTKEEEEEKKEGHQKTQECNQCPLSLAKEGIKLTEINRTNRIIRSQIIAHSNSHQWWRWWWWHSYPAKLDAPTSLLTAAAAVPNGIESMEKAAKA